MNEVWSPNRCTPINVMNGRSNWLSSHMPWSKMPKSNPNVPKMSCRRIVQTTSSTM